MISPWNTRLPLERNIENIELSLPEILPVYLADCQLRLPATNTAYLVGLRGHRKLINTHGKFAAVSQVIWQTGLWNLEKSAGESCGSYTWQCCVSTVPCTHNTFLNRGFAAAALGHVFGTASEHTCAMKTLRRTVLGMNAKRTGFNVASRAQCDILLNCAI